MEYINLDDEGGEDNSNFVIDQQGSGAFPPSGSGGLNTNQNREADLRHDHPDDGEGFANVIPISSSSKRQQEQGGEVDDMQQPLFDSSIGSRQDMNTMAKVLQDCVAMLRTLEQTVEAFLRRCFADSFSVHGERYRVVRELGEGGFSFVYLVENSRRNQFALKKMVIQTSEQARAVKWEVEVHRAFRHPNLLPLVDYQIRQTHHHEEALLLFPVYTRGSLLDVLQSMALRNEIMDDPTILDLFLQIAQGLAAMHAHQPPWAHRDIKPGNVLLSHDNVPVLMDFGSTTVARIRIDSRAKSLDVQEHASQHSSMAYRAPELWDPPTGFTIDERSDIWSMGCLLFAMAFGAGFSPFECQFRQDGMPYGTDCTYLRVIGKIPFPPSSEMSRSDEMKNIIVWMLNQETEQRPNIEQVIQRTRELKQKLNNSINVTIS